MRTRRAISAVVVVLVAAGTAPGEWVEFVEGGAAQVAVSVRGDEVEVEAPGGPYHFRKEDFRRIEPVAWPEAEWPKVRAGALDGGASDRMKAARWALERGLVSEAEGMYRAAHEADPEAQPAKRCVSALDRLEGACPTSDLGAVRKALGGRFFEVEGPHVVLLHQHDEGEAEARLRFLETIVTAYYLEFARLGFDLPGPRRKLPVAWFARKADYQAYLRREGASAFLSTRGYHHPSRGLVAFYDARDDPEYERGHKVLEMRLRELKLRTVAGPPEKGDRHPAQGRFLGKSKISVGPGASPLFPPADTSQPFEEIQELRGRLDRQRLLHELRWRALDLGTAAHEMVHALMAASRLAPGPGAFPLWLNEGLAMQFEAVRGDEWAGLGVPSPLRLEDWRDLKPPPSLGPLLEDQGLGHGYSQKPYAEAWALVYDLRTREPEALVALIDRLRVPGADDGEGRVVEAFSRAVRSDLGVYQAGWHDRMGRLETWGTLETPIKNGDRHLEDSEPVPVFDGEVRAEGAPGR